MIKNSNSSTSSAVFITNYEGGNKKITDSRFKQTSQEVIFKENAHLNGGVTERLCFEFTLLKRKFLIVLDYERIYEIIEDEGEKVYVLLTQSWIYFTNHFVDKDKYIVHGLLNLHYVYTENAEYIEHFKFQLNIENTFEVVEMFETIHNLEEIK